MKIGGMDINQVVVLNNPSNHRCPEKEERRMTRREMEGEEVNNKGGLCSSSINRE